MIGLEQGRTSRRRFLQDASAAALTAETLTLPATASAGRRRKRRQTVAVLGGGIAGLTAAHELIQRGFAVTVYERHAWGGRARGRPLPGTARDGRAPLPSEHSWHGYFGAYKNYPETLRQIPSATGQGSAYDHLVPMPQGTFSRAERADIVLPFRPFGSGSITPAQLQEMLIAVGLQLDLPPEAAAHLANRLAVHLSSCDARRYGEIDRIPWTTFIDSDRYGGDYRDLIGEFPQLVFAAKADRASAHFTAWVLETLFVYTLSGLDADAPTVQVLDGPVYDVLFNPWVKHLRHLGVRLRRGCEVTALKFRDGRITEARVRTAHGHQDVRADWFVCALPVQGARRLWSNEIRAAAPELAGMRALRTADSTGVNFYLNRTAPLEPGAYGLLNAPWSPQFIDQAWFFRGDFADQYGDGATHGCLSVAIACWDRPGILLGKPVRDCTKDEYAEEIWAQVKSHINKPGETALLTDDMVVRWHVDDGITRRQGRLVNEQPLVIPVAGTRAARPAVNTAIRNLLLAGDYVDGEWEIGIMEAANFAGRRAANAILDRVGSKESRVPTSGPYRPRELESLWAVDADRYKDGLPNLLDSD